jgi:hypothetical protein
MHVRMKTRTLLAGTDFTRITIYFKAFYFGLIGLKP